MNAHSPIPMTISVRAFTERLEQDWRKRGSYGDEIVASRWSLIFDCETTDDETQALRFGFYQLRQADALQDAGAFYDSEALTKSELALLKQFAKAKGIECLERQQFLDRYLVGLGYDLGAAYIGFNLPFDLSRLAIGHSDAKPSRGSHSMVGGFSFQYSEDLTKPRIQVKHLSSRSSLIRFTIPRDKQHTPGGMRRRGIQSADRRGHFIDLRSFAAALLSGSWSLDSLSRFLGTEHQKLQTKEHGKVTAEYLEYAFQDVQATWECYVELSKRYQKLNLKTRPEKIISEASLGKAYLDQMGVRPWSNVQPDFPRKILGAVMSSYYGGRAEVHARRTAVPVAYCDFLSMYPTVCVLMNLWRFVIASGIRCKDATAWTTDLLNSVTVEQLRSPDLWKRLTVLVRVRPDADVFPVRAKYDGDNRSIGLNVLSSNEPLWFTLADCIASKLIIGKAPQVLEAIAFRPAEPQDGLKCVSIAGNVENEVNPLEHDFFKRVIELRSAVKDRLRNAKPEEKEALQTEQQALKICANATSYGIFVELNPTTHSRPVEQRCFGCSDDPFAVSTTTVEEPGKFFNPILGTLVTGAARLMLALCETVADAQGLTWAFCDTDGIALTPKPEFEGKLLKATTSVREWFEPLCPYEGTSDILKLEDENFALSGDKGFEQLYCFAVSAKRYAMFNLNADGSIVLRKATAHGLGHLMAPYEDEEAPNDLARPVMDLHKLGLRRWHADLWYCVVKSGLGNEGLTVDLTSMPGLERPAVSKFAATTPELLRWFDRYNEGKEYRSQVRPFGFMLSYQPRKELGSTEIPRASAPFHRDTVKGAERCFDRETGESISKAQLRTVREALTQFHLHPESKFFGGNYAERGFTQRRHVRAVGIEHIGKESNRWEESVAVGENLSPELCYGASPEQERVRLANAIEACRRCNRRHLAAVSGVSLREVTRILTGKVVPTKEILTRLETGCLSVHDAQS